VGFLPLFFINVKTPFPQNARDYTKCVVLLSTTKIVGFDLECGNLSSIFKLGRVDFTFEPMGTVARHARAWIETKNARVILDPLSPAKLAAGGREFLLRHMLR
jgi:hypothetical protein